MSDVIYVLLGIGFFALAVAFAHFCRKIR